MRVPMPALFLVVPLAVAACGNTYHPEYHPVSVMHYEQQIAYPVSVQTGARPAPVIVAPAPAAPPGAPPGEDPSPWARWPGQ